MSEWSCHTKLGNRPAEAAAPTGSRTQRFLVVDLLDTPWLRLDDSEGQQMTSNTNPDPTESAARSSLDQETTSPYVEDHQGQEPPESLVTGSVDLYDRDGLHIWADLNTEGALVISGQDLRPPCGWDEYEYSFTIPPEDLPLIGAALGGTHNNSVLNLLAAEGERIVPGVQSWLDSVGARYEFWNRIEPG
jgi:hypothetical protein